MSVERRPDAGFTMVETLVALALATIVMTSLTVFLVGSRRIGHYGALRDTGVQLVIDGMEKARGVRGSALLSGRQLCVTGCATVVPGAASMIDAGAARWDAAGTGTLIVPQPGTQPDGSVVAAPGDAEVVVLDGVVYRRYYYVSTCRQAAVAGSVANASCVPGVAGAELARLVIAVTWTGTACPAATCSFADAALFSIAVADPFLIT
jgi:prepilin-type N-terminal cleavage/methylation domain-containing protein